MLTCCAHTIQNNAIQTLTAKIGVTWDNSAIFPSHLPLWNNAALYEWTTVRKISGMALKAGWNTVLHYQRTRHWPFTLHTVVFFRFFFGETSSHKILQQTSNTISIVQKEPRVQQPWGKLHHLIDKHALRWSTTAGNSSYQTTERCSKSRQYSTHESTQLSLYKDVLLCTSTCDTSLITDPKWRRRGVSHIWVLSNTMAHCDQKTTENNPHSGIIVPIQLQHSACLAMRQCIDILLSPHRLGFIKMAGIKDKLPVLEKWYSTIKAYRLNGKIINKLIIELIT